VSGAPGPDRANICPILAATGRQLTVEGLDAVVGTPVLDIKPVMAGFLPGGTRQPRRATTLMREYFTS